MAERVWAVSAAILESFGFEVVEGFISEDHVDGGFDVVGDANELDLVVRDDDVAGSNILVSRLADAADVDDGAFGIDDGVAVFEFVDAVEVGVFEEDARDVGVADKSEVFDAFEVGADLAGVGVDIVREEVLGDGSSWGAVHEENVFHFESDGHFTEEGPALVSFCFVGFVLEGLSGPIAGSFGAGVEVGRFVEDGLVVVSHDADDASLENEVEALSWLWSVSDDIAKAEDLFDSSLVDVIEDGL